MMTEEQEQAYDWALTQQFNSVAARYARTLALYIKENEEYIRAGMDVEALYPNWRNKFESLFAAVKFHTDSQNKRIKALQKRIDRLRNWVQE